MKTFDGFQLEDLLRGVFRGGADASFYYGTGYSNGWVDNPIGIVRKYRSLKPQIYAARVEIDLMSSAGIDAHGPNRRAKAAAWFPGDRRGEPYSYVVSLRNDDLRLAGRRAFKLKFPKWVHPVNLHQMIELQDTLCDYMYLDWRGGTERHDDHYVLIRRFGEVSIIDIPVRLKA